MSFDKKVVIIGAGPSGLSVAWELARKGGGGVTVLESLDCVGGLSRTAEREGIRYDAGPHRFSGQLPDLLEAVRELLGDSLRPLPNSHGLFIDGHRYSYPPSPSELFNPAAVGLAVSSGCSWAGAMARNAGNRLRGGAGPDNLADVLASQFGRRFCEKVIFPMIRKVYGTTDLHPQVAGIRFIRAAFSAIGKRVFLRSREYGDSDSYYPPEGFSQIWDGIAEYCRGRGQRFELGVEIESVEAESLRGPFTVRYVQGGEKKEEKADVLVSSISNAALLGYLEGTGLVDRVLPLRRSFSARTMRLAVMVVKGFSLPIRVIIFPEEKYIFNRIAEMNQFADLGYPEGHSVLMLDVICDGGSEYDTMPEDDFNRLVRESALSLGWFRGEDIKRLFSTRYPDAYPVITKTRYDSQVALDGHFADTGVVLCGREASTDYNNVHNAMSKGFLAARYIRGEMTYADYDREAKIIGRLPILDY